MKHSKVPFPAMVGSMLFCRARACGTSQGRIGSKSKQRSQQLDSANDGERDLSGPEIYADALRAGPGPDFRRRDPGNDHHTNAAVGGGGLLVSRALGYPDLHHADGAGADVRSRIGGCSIGQARPGLVQHPS